MAKDTIKINRAPVMTLWAAVAAEQLGFDRDEALTLGRAVAGLNAQAYDLYTRFRPEVASGTRGWGQAGALDLELIESLAGKS